jgi:DNA-binding Lrp family transcriptional regulator
MLHTGKKMSSKKRETERKALNLIYDAGEEGLFQTEIWKLLDLSSREASRIVKKFEEKGNVYRERVLNNGRWTYKIFLSREFVTLESIEDCPCLVCPDINKCFRGGQKDPAICLDLTAWIDPRIEPLREHS